LRMRVLKHTQPYTLDSLLLLGACSNVLQYATIFCLTIETPSRRPPVRPCLKCRLGPRYLYTLSFYLTHTITDYPFTVKLCSVVFIQHKSRNP